MVRYTAAQLAAEAGVSETEVRRYVRALGFPDSGDQAPYDDADLAVLRTLTDAIRGSDLDVATAVRLVRAAGQNVARLADWQAAALASRAEELGGDAGTVRATTERLAEQLEEAIQALLVHSWRRHLGVSLARLGVDTVDADDEQSRVTVGFADLVGFSALSNDLDPDRLGALVEIFEARSGDVVATYDGRMVKTIGDSVLFVSDSAVGGVDIAHGLLEVIGGDARLPDVRIGLASGLVVTRLGDVFGPPVNLAARLTAVARRNRVIVDHDTASQLAGSAYETRRLTGRPLRGFGVVEPVAVRRRPLR